MYMAREKIYKLMFYIKRLGSSLEITKAILSKNVLYAKYKKCKN